MSDPATKSRSADIRNRLTFPIVDVDGHQAPIDPGFGDYLVKEGGSRFAARYRAKLSESSDPRLLKLGGLEIAWYDLSWEQRRDRRAQRGGWWGSPAKNTLDRATGSLPRLLYERLDEIGIDFTILYAGGLFTLPMEQDEEIRRVASRAINAFQADLYAEFADRMTVVAVIPMHTPEEGISALEHAVNKLGFKVIAVPPGIQRPISELHRRAPEAFPRAHWFDTYGLDSAHDYDPFWQRCVDLKVAVTSHGGVVPGLPWHGTAISSYMSDHIGTHAYQQSLLCKSLFLGGVTRRFPTLNFAFLECGVGFACSLYADLVGHWEKRNRQAMEALDPACVDREYYVDLVARYGGERLHGELNTIRGRFDLPHVPLDEELLDEWRHLAVTRKDELRELFCDRFYFGCEADDPINAWGFNRKVNPLGAQLKPAFSSDITHWDVPDISRVVEEAYELVEHGVISEDDFRDFVSHNPIRLHAGMNPDFFKGTAVESYAEKLLQGGA